MQSAMRRSRLVFGRRWAWRTERPTGSPSRVLRRRRRAKLPRLLVVTTIARTAEAFLLPYARHFRAAGWEVHLLAAGSTGSQICADAYNRVFEAPWTRSPRDLLGVGGLAVRQAARVAAAGRYDIVHVHTPIASFVTRWALRRFRQRGLKVVYTAHGFHFYRIGRVIHGRAFLVAERLASRWTDGLVVINEEDFEAALDLGVARAGQVTLMPGIGIDAAAYRAAAESASAMGVRAQIGVPLDAPLHLVVGELNEGKRPLNVVRSLAKSRQQDAHLAFAGVGSMEGQARALAEELSVADRVHFLGFRTDVPALLSAATALVLVSEREGLPRCVLEAMAVGLPVIGSDVRGTRDLIKAGAGVLVPLDDVHALAGAMDALLNDHELRARISMQARAAILNYDLGRVIPFHEELYRQLGVNW